VFLYFRYFFNLILVSIFSLYVPCVGVEGEKCKFLVGCWLLWLPCKFHKQMYLQIFFPLRFINSIVGIQVTKRPRDDDDDDDDNLESNGYPPLQRHSHFRWRGRGIRA